VSKLLSSVLEYHIFFCFESHFFICKL
jgi:hypothetical protein